MATLNDYLQQTQRFLRDPREQHFGVEDLISYVNRARREVAMRSQSIRRLTPIAGQVVTASVTSAGTGYTLGATVTISAPDFPSGDGPSPGGAQATAQPVLLNGALSAVDILYGGEGYFQPTASVTAAAGSGASVTLGMSPLNLLTANKEVYPFSGIDLSMFPGVQSVHAVKSISVLFSNYRYSLPVYSFSVYQSMIRQYANQYRYVPTFAAQFGQGVDGSFYVYPIPSQTYQYELDCFCLPQDLLTDLSVEAIPAPWVDAVPYFAAALCYQEIQNFNAARFYEEEFDKFLLRYSQYARPGRVVNPYGRYIWIAIVPFIDLWARFAEWLV